MSSEGDPDGSAGGRLIPLFSDADGAQPVEPDPANQSAVIDAAARFREPADPDDAELDDEPDDAEVVAAGRARLRREMTTRQPPDPRACTCDECSDHPLTSIEADAALDHVTADELRRFALGQITLHRYAVCDTCESWRPRFRAIDGNAGPVDRRMPDQRCVI